MSNELQKVYQLSFDETKLYVGYIVNVPTTTKYPDGKAVAFSADQDTSRRLPKGDVVLEPLILWYADPSEQLARVMRKEIDRSEHRTSQIEAMLNQYRGDANS